MKITELLFINTCLVKQLWYY